MAKESRVIHLSNRLESFGMGTAWSALDYMINVMNADNGYARKDGSHYYYHLVDATQDLLNHGVEDEPTITACLLHDAVEDVEGIDLNTIRMFFGYEVAEIVDGVTKKDYIDYNIDSNLQEYLDDMLNNVKKCLVKTADRKHNFSTLYATSGKHEIRQANQTEKFFMPFFKEARRLYPEYSAYFHSAKTTIMPHLKRIQKAHEDEVKFKDRIGKLEYLLELERKRIKSLENKIRRGF